MTVALKKKASEVAAQLTLKQRVEFAEALITGVEDFVSPQIERAWDKEIKRRLEELRSGKVRAVPAARVRTGMRRRLHEIETHRISSRRGT